MAQNLPYTAVSAIDGFFNAHFPVILAQPELLSRNLSDVVAELDSRSCPAPSPEYFATDFEKKFRCSYLLPYVVRLWWTPWVTVALYITAVVLGQKVMALRGKPFQLRKPLIAWNAALAVFSILGTARCAVLFQLVYERGLKYTLLHDG
jgi:hypothetical protein